MNAAKETLDVALDIANQLHRSALRLLRVLRTVRSVDGLGMSKLGVLGRLYRDGTATATELAAYLRVQPQSLTRLVDDLEKRSLITRRSDIKDRRQSLLEITKTGEQVLTETVRDQRESLAQTILDVLTPAEQELLRLSAGLIDKLAAATEASVATSDTLK
jgi:DNA-binding MarR family transcriptional regulator